MLQKIPDERSDEHVEIVPLTYSFIEIVFTCFSGFRGLKYHYCAVEMPAEPIIADCFFIFPRPI